MLLIVQNAGDSVRLVVFGALCGVETEKGLNAPTTR